MFQTNVGEDCRILPTGLTRVAPDGLPAGVGVLVKVGALVRDAVGVTTRVGVLLTVADGERVRVLVEVGEPTIAMVAVMVLVGVFVFEGVTEAVRVGEAVGVRVGEGVLLIAVRVLVGVGLDVPPGNGRPMDPENNNLFGAPNTSETTSVVASLVII